MLALLILIIVTLTLMLILMLLEASWRQIRRGRGGLLEVDLEVPWRPLGGLFEVQRSCIDGTVTCKYERLTVPVFGCQQISSNPQTKAPWESY